MIFGPKKMWASRKRRPMMRQLRKSFRISLRRGAGRDVEVLGPPAEQQVAHAAADQVGLVVEAVQAADDLQRRRGRSLDADGNELTQHPAGWYHIRIGLQRGAHRARSRRTDSPWVPAGAGPCRAARSGSARPAARGSGNGRRRSGSRARGRCAAGGAARPARCFSGRCWKAAGRSSGSWPESSRGPGGAGRPAPRAGAARPRPAAGAGTRRSPRSGPARPAPRPALAPARCRR